jgi:hypothetical protein
MSNYHFRTKFATFVATAEQLAFWDNEFAPFLGLDERAAEDFLLDFSLYREAARSTSQDRDIILTGVKNTQVFESWVNHFPPELAKEMAFKLLLNEMVHQYRNQRSKGFLKNEDTKLNEALGAPLTVALYRLLKEYMAVTNHDFDRTLFLLSSEEEKNFCGGLAEIGCKKPLVAALKVHHKLVAETFKTFYSRKETVPAAVTPRSPHPTPHAKSTTPQQPATPTGTAKSNPAATALRTNLPLEFVIKNKEVLKELENYPWLISLLSKESMRIPEVFNFLGEAGTKPAPSVKLLQFLVENYNLLKGHTPATIKEALAKANDPATLQAALLAALGNN